MWAKLTIPGIASPLSKDDDIRMSGHSERSVRTDSQRREDNRRCHEQYNRLPVVQEDIEHASRAASVPGRTRRIEERDERNEEEKHKNHSTHDANMPTFYPPPRTTNVADINGIIDPQITCRNVSERADMEQVGASARRRSIIELAPALDDISLYDCTMDAVQLDGPNDRTGKPCVRFPIHDLEWRENVYVHVETQWYYSYVGKLTDYNRIQLEEVIRLSNNMVERAGGYRLSAMELQELNCRRQSYIAGQKHAHSSISTAIAPRLIDIFRRGVIPEYPGPPPPDKRVARYPYVGEATEK